MKFSLVGVSQIVAIFIPKFKLAHQILPIDWQFIAYSISIFIIVGGIFHL
jgi:hypothetical protein